MKTFEGLPTQMKFGVGCAVIGAAVAVAVLAYDYFFLVGPDGVNRATAREASLFFILCPSSMTLMGLEHPSSMQLMVGLLFMVLINAGLYGFVGWLAVRLLTGSTSRQTDR